MLSFQQLKVKEMEKLQAQRRNRAHVGRLLEEKTREIADLRAKVEKIEGVQETRRRVVYFIRGICALSAVAVMLYVAVSAWRRSQHNPFTSGLDVMCLVH